MAPATAVARTSRLWNRVEVVACRPWLIDELELVSPEVLVVLGATAAQALLGPTFRITASRGQALPDTGLASTVVATVHPSSILRVPDPTDRSKARAVFTSDLRVAADLAGL